MTKKRKSNIPPESPNKQDVNLESKRIEILINHLDHRYFEGLLVDYFNRKISPAKPVYVKYDASYQRIDSETVYTTFKNFQIVEFNDNRDIYSNPLARIIIQKYPSHTAIFIEAIESKSNAWEKVKIITKEIISKIQHLKFEIDSVNPSELLAGSLLPAWEQIPNHYSDREILRLWHEGHTNSEIAAKVGLAKRTITNILSRLRQKQPKLVPTAEELRKLLRKSQN